MTGTMLVVFDPSSNIQPQGFFRTPGTSGDMGRPLRSFAIFLGKNSEII